MSISLFEEGALAHARLVLKNYPGARVNVDVATEAKRTAFVLYLAIPRTRDLADGAGIRNLAVVISAAAAKPDVSRISRQLRQTTFELWRADLIFLEGEGGLR